MRKIFNSLRSRIVLCILLAGIIPVVLLHVIVVNTYESNLIEQRTIEIKQRCNMIATQLGAYESIEDSLSPEMIRVINWYSDAYAGRILVVDRQYKVALDTYAADLGKTIVSEPVFSAFLGNEYEYYESSDHYLEFVVPVQYSDGTDHVTTAALILSSTTEWMENALSKVERGMILIEVILFILFVVIALYVSYRTMYPVKSISYELMKMEAGEMNGDLTNLRSYQEVDDILLSSAEIIEKYKQMEKTQEEFVSNVSHELRTPMTSIRVLSDSLLGQTDLPEEVYQEFLQDISIEIDRGARIIDDLLSMAKLGQAADLHIRDINLNEFLLEILKTIRPIAQKRNIELVFESFRKVHADVDETKLTQAITNLVENAVKYTNDGGQVKVSLDGDHEYFYVRVADNGVGIPEDALPHVFDRFYRVDKARSRDTGGTGLGLSIARQIILLHYGIIKVESKVGDGTTFTVRIPLKHVDHKGGWKE